MNWHVLVVDLQQGFAPHILGWDAVLSRALTMINAARALDIPITATEQYPARLGATVPAVKEALGDAPLFEKTAFSCLRVPEVKARVTAAVPVNLLLLGIETHVCLLQTALDALALDGVRPHLLVDAISSRRALDRDTAFERLARAGAVLSTVESAIFETLEEAGTARFKRILPLVK
jgi:nicotinamidase-related amidase